jgi:hypothetical protein
MHKYAIPLVQQSFIDFGVTLVGTLIICFGALAYFRRVRMERPPIGTFNGRDIAILLTLIIALPFLYAVMPSWTLTIFLCLTFAASLSIGYTQVFGQVRLWLVLGLLLGANIWESQTMMGSVTGWQVWWVEIDILVALGAIAVANLYVQGGMRLQHVVWFALGLAVYDVFASLVVNVTAVLVEDFIGKPLDPTFGMRFQVNNYGIGIGDLLVAAMFVIACYKAYGRVAARTAIVFGAVFCAAAPSLCPLLFALIDFRNDILVPSQLFFAPPAFLYYLWLKRRYGPERTMAEYVGSEDCRWDRGAIGQPAPAREPAAV